MTLVVPNTFLDLPKTPAGFTEQQSYSIISNLILARNWVIFTTKASNFPLDDTIALSCIFSNHFALAPTDLDDLKSICKTTRPMGTFRYPMVAAFRNSIHHQWNYLTLVNKANSFIVEGSFWLNGFYYIVRENERFLSNSVNPLRSASILEVNLFIDVETALTAKISDGTITLNEFLHLPNM